MNNIKYGQLVQEKFELTKKRTNLEIFLKSDDFKNLDLLNRVLLYSQLNAMLTYEQILMSRIELNKKDVKDE